MAVLKITKSDTSLAMISASIHMAVLICAAPPCPLTSRTGFLLGLIALGD